MGLLGLNEKASGEMQSRPNKTKDNIVLCGSFVVVFGYQAVVRI